MTGFTYQAAAHMISEGLAIEGLALCRAIHDRYAESPLRRNPFNEIEYGNHYTRAMSSYGAYIGASGFEYHGPKGQIGFAPKLNPDKFRGAFTAAEGWGTYAQEIHDKDEGKGSVLTARLTLKWGQLHLQTITLLSPRSVRVARVDGRNVRFAQHGHRVTIELPDGVELSAAQSMEIELR